jgi:hypothetical protein
VKKVNVGTGKDDTKTFFPFEEEEKGERRNKGKEKGEKGNKEKR